MDRILEFKSFDWWESDDLIKWSANSFYSWENIEVRKNLSALQLSPLLEDTGWIFDASITFIANLETLWVPNWWIVVCLHNWKIFFNWVLKTTLVSTTTAHNRVYWIWVNEDLTWTQYVYYVTWTSFWAWKIHRSTTNLATFDVAFKAYTVSSWNTWFVWVINNVWLMYIAVKNKVFLMEQDEIVQTYLTLPDNEWIKWFTQFQWRFKIYTSIWNTGVQYIWNWVSTAVLYRQEWINLPVLWVVNNWAYDYAVLWPSSLYSNLYLISWTQKQLLKANLSTASYSRILWQYLSIRDWIIYINWWKSWQSQNEWIYTYWNYYPWTKKSLVQSYSWLNIQWFLQQVHTDQTSYFAANNNKVYTISHINPPSYVATWYVITNMYQGFIWEEKNLNFLKVWFKLNGWSIKIYARTEMNLSVETTWNLIKTIDNATYWSKKSVRIDNNEVIRSWVNLWTFNEIQFKFELNSDIWWWNTPLLYNTTVWLTTLNNK